MGKFSEGRHLRGVNGFQLVRSKRSSLSILPDFNGVVRPLLATWHPLLEDWEHRRPAEVTRRDHERAWPHHDELRAELDRIWAVLIDYARILAQACDAPSLMVANTQIIEATGPAQNEP